MSLDKLRALVEAECTCCVGEGPCGNCLSRLALSHLLLPAMEALVRTADLLAGIEEGEGELHAVRHAHAVFARLEEALK